MSVPIAGQRRQSVSVSPNIAIGPNSPPALAAAQLATSPPGLASFSASYELRRTANPPYAGKALAPFPIRQEPVKLLLLENINATAVKMLKDAGYHVEEVKKALGEDELIQRLRDGGFSAVGIRSKTKVTARVISEVPSVSSTVSRETCSPALVVARFVSMLTNLSVGVAARHRLLLHRYQPSRPARRRPRRYRRLQLAVLQLALRRRTRHL
jgi:hypothetical protein